MAELSELLNINKKSAKSFYQQKKLISALMAGKQVKCQQCAQPLSLVPDEDNVVISCQRNCTHILLELAS